MAISDVISRTCEIPNAAATRRASGAWPRSNMTTLSVKLVLVFVTAPSWKPLPSTLSPYSAASPGTAVPLSTVTSISPGLVALADLCPFRPCRRPIQSSG